MSMQNSEKQKLKSEIAKLKAENKQLKKKLKANEADSKKKIAVAVSAAEDAICSAYEKGYSDAAAGYELKAKEKAKVLAEAEADFNKKYAKKAVKMSKASGASLKKMGVKKKAKKSKAKAVKMVKEAKPKKSLAKKQKRRSSNAGMIKPFKPTPAGESVDMEISSVRPTPVEEKPSYKSDFEF